MARVSSLTIVDSGWGYTIAPTITISAPDADSANAAATSILSGNSISSINLTDSGYWYANTPTVTISLPDADSDVATATVNLDSAEAAQPFSITSLTTTDSGAYYLSAPSVSLSTTQSPPTNWEDSAAKYGTYSYRLNQNYDDSDYNNFSNKDDAGSDVKYDHILEFWIKTPVDTLVGDILKFPQVNDTTGNLNQIEINGLDLVYKWSEASGVSGNQIQSAGNTLTPEVWHFVQILRDFDGSAVDVKMYIDGQVADYVDNRPLNIDNLIESTVRFINHSSVDGVMFDAIRLTQNDSPIFGPSNIPDSDRNPFPVASYSASPITLAVTVADPGDGNAYYIDGVPRATLNLYENNTYRFDQSDATNDTHPLRISTSSDGTHGVGSEYTTGVTTNGTPGQAGAYTQITVAAGAPKLYYYCTAHSGMGGAINTPFFGENTNYLGFELQTPLVTSSITNARVSDLTVINKGNYLTSATATIDSATGTAYDFRATATASVDSASGGRISSIAIVDSGDFYTSAPTVTIDSADGTAASYRATATATLTNSGEIDYLTITDSGGGYITAPSVSISAPAYTDLYLDDSAEQTLASGVVVRGEVVKYSDSDGILYLAHVGASDGKYHTFVTGRDITFGSINRYTRNVLAVSEENQISNNEQNDDFSTIADDFLDFTEDNPFGEPS